MVKIIAKEEQSLLRRTLVKASVAFEGPTPARDSIREKLAQILKVPEEQVIVKKVKTQYGVQEAEVEAMVYPDIEDAKAVENKSLIAKHAKKEEPKEESSESAEDTEESA